TSPGSLVKLGGSTTIQQALGFLNLLDLYPDGAEKKAGVWRRGGRIRGWARLEALEAPSVPRPQREPLTFPLGQLRPSELLQQFDPLAEQIGVVGRVFEPRVEPFERQSEQVFRAEQRRLDDSRRIGGFR